LKALHITINLENESLQGDHQAEEVGRILTEYSDTLRADWYQVPRIVVPLHDYNGNKVGEAKITGR
jgi:hypothetical protein